MNTSIFSCKFLKLVIKFNTRQIQDFFNKYTLLECPMVSNFYSIWLKLRIPAVTVEILKQSEHSEVCEILAVLFLLAT